MTKNELVELLKSLIFIESMRGQTDDLDIILNKAISEFIGIVLPEYNEYYDEENEDNTEDKEDFNEFLNELEGLMEFFDEIFSETDAVNEDNSNKCQCSTQEKIVDDLLKNIALDFFTNTVGPEEVEKIKQEALKILQENE